MKRVIGLALTLLSAWTVGAQTLSFTTKDLPGTEWEFFAGSSWPAYYIRFDAKGTSHQSRSTFYSSEDKSAISGSYSVVSTTKVLLTYEVSSAYAAQGPESVTVSGTLRYLSDSVQYAYAIVDPDGKPILLCEDKLLPANLKRDFQHKHVVTMVA